VERGLTCRQAGRRRRISSPDAELTISALVSLDCGGGERQVSDRRRRHALLPTTSRSFYVSLVLLALLPASLFHPFLHTLHLSSKSNHRRHGSAVSPPPPPLLGHPSLFHLRLKPFFLQILPTTVAFLFFCRTDSTDSPDCLPIGLLLGISVFFTFLFSTCQLLVPCGRLS